MHVSPYFTGDQVFPFSEFPCDTAKASTMEAKAYSLSFPDWKPASFEHWPATNGLVSKTRSEGHTESGVHGPFHGTGDHVEALERRLAQAGISA